ncbi:peptidoglycan-binding domain-containing protein [uncultured Microscilla sp.]|uniref:peptidoglycan-binding domain-containing protein n=1 Tax=uncultured Microscilla sp. TaxID=432653 RepID=UPI00261E2258|nr:peptidoglycan-binding domain-containing protein [uncultured Microscilla sp.]
MTDKQKKQIGAIAGIGIIGFLIWYIFLDGKEKIKVAMPLRKKKTPRLDYGSGSSSSGGSSGSSGQISSGSSGGYGYKAEYPMQFGSKGEDVKELQQALHDANFSPGAIDGIWGQNTQKAMESALGKYGIPTIRHYEDLKYVLNNL